MFAPWPYGNKDLRMCQISVRAGRARGDEIPSRTVNKTLSSSRVGCNRHLRFVSPEPQTKCGIGSEHLKTFHMKYMPHEVHGRVVTRIRQPSETRARKYCMSCQGKHFG